MIPNYNPYFFLDFFRIPQNCDKPPTVYSILNSIVNGDKEFYEEEVKIKDLAKAGRKIIFNFDYPLSENISKEEFEVMILNHYLMRRIGFETVTAFRIQLDVKLNEIMPFYNKMFDSLENWDIFKDGETVTREGFDNRESQNTASNTLNNTSETSNVSDRRNSELPQNQLSELRDGNYVTDYNYDTSNATDVSKSVGNSSSNTNEKNNYKEIISKTSNNKIEILKEMQKNIKSVYTLIFKDLDDLFYGLV